MTLFTWINQYVNSLVPMVIAPYLTEFFYFLILFIIAYLVKFLLLTMFSFRESVTVKKYSSVLNFYVFFLAALFASEASPAPVTTMIGQSNIRFALAVVGYMSATVLFIAWIDRTKKIESEKLRQTLRKSFIAFFSFAGFIKIAEFVMPQISSVTGYVFAFFFIALIFGIRTILTDFVYAQVLNISKPFQIGDKIECGDIRGQVMQIHWSHITLTDEGAIKIIPTSYLLGKNICIIQKRY